MVRAEVHVTTRRLTQRGRERRAQLLEIAARQFAEGGYHPTSVAEIVEAAGVGKGVFYWYFESKEALFTEILRDANISLRRRQQAALGNEPDPIRRLELGILASMHWYHEHRYVFNLFQFAQSETEFAAILVESQETALNDASQAHYGAPLGYIGQGGTIPLMSLLQQGFPNAQMMVCGVLGPKSNAHGPNEFLHLPYAKKLTAAVAQVVAACP